MAPEYLREAPLKARPIQKLPESLINQIAAGEVVERPASIVKELVENALDAGASRVDVELKAGGIEEIKITDNGWGMESTEILLAFERHATSKIHSAKELEEIGTFGFRGEALSSIASVSDITLTTRRFNADYATELTLHSGALIDAPKKSGGATGTSITVRSLFSKVPGRLKFLRTPATELSHALRTLKEIALGNPQTVFSLSHHNRTLALFAQTSLLERFKEVLRPNWEPVCFEDATEGMQYVMLLSPIEQADVKTELYLFINNRPIKNRILLQAVKQAYLDVYGPGKEPAGSVYLSIRADWVDPNVHPQKHEVRFLRQEVIFQWLLSSLRKKLSATKTKNTEPVQSANSKTFLENTAYSDPSFEIQFKTSLRDGILLYEDKEGILLTHENRMKEISLLQLLSKNPKPESLHLPTPLLCSLSSLQKEAFPSFKELLEKTGFDMEIFSEGDIAIKAIPSFLPETQASDCLKEILSQNETRTEHAFYKKLSLFASQGCLKAPLNGLSPFTQTPDGKPLFFRVLFEDLKRYF